MISLFFKDIDCNIPVNVNKFSQVFHAHKDIYLILSKSSSSPQNINNILNNFIYNLRYYNVLLITYIWIVLVIRALWSSI